MHGQIALDSSLGIGTAATFSIPFSKPHFVNGPTPLISIGSIPDRLQSDLSVSGCTSEHDRGSSTPPQSPLEMLGTHKHAALSQHADRGSSASLNILPDLEACLSESDRHNIHVLVVEDKYVLKIYLVYLPLIPTVPSTSKSP